MKAVFLTAIISLLSAVALLANPPVILAIQAAQIAQEDLEARSLQGEIYIMELNFKKGRLGSEDHWEVLWSKSFPAQTKGRNEIGLKISMDGSYTRAVR